MSEDIGASMPKAGPENLPSNPNRFKPGRFASQTPVNHKVIDVETRKVHAADPYVGIILPSDETAHAEDDDKDKETKTTDE